MQGSPLATGQSPYQVSPDKNVSEMNLTDIKRPEILEINSSDLNVELSTYQRIHYEEDDELVDIFIAPTLVISQEDSNDGKFNLPIDSKMFDQEVYKKFNRLTYSLGKMVRLAEYNADRLSKLIGQYLSVYPSDEVLNRNGDCKKCLQYEVDENFGKLTFGNLKSILSCIIKTDTNLHSVPELDTTGKRKEFTKIYHNYIEDRDRFTHGILFFLYPDLAPILRVKTKESEDQYITYSKEVFLSNLETFDYLDSVLSKIRAVIEGGLTP